MEAILKNAFQFGFIKNVFLKNTANVSHKRDDERRCGRSKDST